MSNSQINGYEIECSGELLDAALCRFVWKLTSGIMSDSPFFESRVP